MASYLEDLAYIHDRGFSEFALRSSSGLLRILRRYSIDRGFVADLGCGNGIWARQLTFAGYRALGIDASPAMIRLARRNAPAAQFRVASLVDGTLPKCDAVTAIGEALSYAFHGDASGRRIGAFFRRVHRALAPGGVFIFDFARTGREPAGMPRKSYWTGDNWAVLVEAEEDAGRRLLTRQLVSFRMVGRCYRRVEETHVLRLYEGGELEERLAAAGFEVHRLRGFGEYRFRSGHGGMVGRKPV
ncbi:MAG: class I SAM-dependent methyltransferase [Bryobacteraceae bacterium]